MPKQLLIALATVIGLLNSGCIAEETASHPDCRYENAQAVGDAGASWENYLDAVVSACDPNVLLEILDGLSKAGDDRAMHQQAVILLHRDRDRAVDLMKKSAALGNADAIESMDSFSRTGEF